MPLVIRMRSCVSLLFVLGVLLPVVAQINEAPKPSFPWSNSKMSPDERAALVLQQMTLDEKITLLHGTGHRGLGPMSPLASGGNGGAGYVVGISRLGIPGIQMSDAAYGVRSSGENGRYSTALPCNLAAAATWDLQGAYEYRSEEHTSELQSRRDLVCRLLLEKKKKKNKSIYHLKNKNKRS